jgi:hypothetical protein
MERSIVPNEMTVVRWLLDHALVDVTAWFTSNEPTARPIELEADAFSGYYMALGENDA